MSLKNLQEIEKKTIKGERNFDFRTALTEIFKALYRLLESKQDVSKKDIVSAAERESKRLGLEGQYNWSEILSLEEAKQSVEQQSKQLTFSNGNPYPDNFYAEKAINDGSCFFDSFRQGLEQQKGIQVTVEQLRDDCRKFAQNNQSEWFTEVIANSYDNSGQHRSETVDDYTANIMCNNRWGDHEVEGRILCEKYGVKLHVVEDQSYFKFLQREVSQDRDGFSEEIQQAIMDFNSNEALARKLQEIDSDEARKLLENVIDHGSLGHTHSLISSSGNLPLDNPDYNDRDTIHILNGGRNHFEPLLNRNKNLAKQPQKQNDHQVAISLLKRASQEESGRLLAEKFQAEEIISFMQSAFQEHLAKQSREPVQEQKDFLLARQLQEKEDYSLAKKLQVDEILEYCNLSKDASERAEVEKMFDELLKENPEGEIHDFIGQCVNNVIKHSEEQNPSSLPKCSMNELRATPHQQQVSLLVK